MARGAVAALLALAVLGGLLWLYLDKVLAIRGLHREIAALRARRAALMERRDGLRYRYEHREEFAELEIRRTLLYGYAYPGPEGYIYPEMVVLFSR